MSPLQEPETQIIKSTEVKGTIHRSANVPKMKMSTLIRNLDLDNEFESHLLLKYSSSDDWAGGIKVELKYARLIFKVIFLKE